MIHPQIKTLSFICSCLAAEPIPGRTEALRGMIRSGTPGWESVIGMANENHVTPAVFTGLRRQGLMEEVPGPARDYLSEMHLLNARRNARLREQVLEAAGALNREGIAPVFLKGAAYLVTALFDDPGARIMADLDIMVEKSHFEAALKVLGENGYSKYAAAKEWRKESYHYPPLFRPGDYATIELHRDLMPEAGSRILPAEEAMANSQDMAAEGIHFRVLTPTYQVMHSMLHVEVVNRYHYRGIICPRHLSDLDWLRFRFGEVVDWDLVCRKMVDHEKTGVWRDYVHLAHVWLKMPLPPGVKPDWGSRLHDVRCRSSIKWGWCRALEKIFEKFSTSSVCAFCHCEEAFLPIMAGRIKVAIYLARRFRKLRGGAWSTGVHH